MPIKKFIDVKKILKERSPKAYKVLPDFLINWLRNKVHEDEINKGMEHLNQFHGLEHNEEILKFLNVKVEVVNPENIPLTGGFIYASNHPLGGLDGMSLIKSVGEVRKDVKFLVNDILRNLTNYDEIFVGVNKVGNSSRQALNIIEEVYSSSNAVIIFPAGLVSRKLKEGIKDLEWNKSFISKAIKYNKVIVPVYIEGRNSSSFYTIAKWRKRLRIKSNLEMLLLPDEMFKQKGKTIRVHIGKKIEPSFFTKQFSEKEWAGKLRDYIYSEDFKKGIVLKP